MSTADGAPPVATGLPEGHGGFTALPTGSVAVALCAHGHRPVAVARTESP